MAYKRVIPYNPGPTQWWVPYQARSWFRQHQYDRVQEHNAAEYARQQAEYLAQQQQQTTDASQSWVTDYNDPYAINSISDLILTTFDPNMSRIDLGGVEDIPILNIVTGLFTDLAWDKTLRPIAEGFQTGKVGEGFSAAGINALISVGETLDIVANPIKAMVQGEDILDAMGWGGEGRKNFDYDIDTGAGEVVDTVGNIALEIISDPLNWITFGGKAAITAATKATVAEAVAATALKKTAVSISDDVVQAIAKRTAHYATNMDESKVLGMRWYDSSGFSIADALDKAVTDVGAGFLVGTFKKTATSPMDVTDIVDMLPDVLKYVETSNRNATLNAVRKLYEVNENAQRGLVRSALYSTAPGMVWAGGKLVSALMSNYTIGRATQADIINSINHVPPEQRTLDVLLTDTDVQRNFDEVVHTMSDEAIATPSEARDYTKDLMIRMAATTVKEEVTTLMKTSGDAAVSQRDQFIAIVTDNVGGSSVEEALDILRNTGRAELTLLAEELQRTYKDILTSLPMEDALTTLRTSTANAAFQEMAQFLEHNPNGGHSLLSPDMVRGLLNNIRDTHELTVDLSNQVLAAKGVFTVRQQAPFKAYLKYFKNVEDLAALSPKQLQEMYSRVVAGYDNIASIVNDSAALQLPNIKFTDVGDIKTLDQLSTQVGDVDKLIYELQRRSQDTPQYFKALDLPTGTPEWSDASTKLYYETLGNFADNVLPKYMNDPELGWVTDTLLSDTLEYALTVQSQEAINQLKRILDNILVKVDDSIAVLKSSTASYRVDVDLTNDDAVTQSADALRVDAIKAQEDITDQLKAHAAYDIRVALEREFLIDMRNDFSEFLDAITAKDFYGDPFVAPAARANVKLTDEVYYKLKMTNLQAQLSLISSPQVQAVIDPGFTDNIRAVLDTASNANILPDGVYDNYVNYVAPQLAGLQHVNELFMTIANSPVLNKSMHESELQKLTRMVQDTFMTYKNNDLIQYRSKDSVEKLTNNIIHDITVQLNAQHNSKSNTVDALIDTFKLQKYTKHLTAHVGQDDVLRQLVVTDKLMGDASDKTHYYLLDLETTGLNLRTDKIHEMAYIPYTPHTVAEVKSILQKADDLYREKTKVMQQLQLKHTLSDAAVEELATMRDRAVKTIVDLARAKVTVHRIDPGIMPSVEVIALGMSDAVAKELGVLVEIDGVFHKQIYGKAEVYRDYWRKTMAHTETVTLEDAYHSLEAAMSSHKDQYPVRFITHNGDDFDIPMLRNQAPLDMQWSWVNTAMRANNNVDTLHLARAKTGYLYLSDAEQEEISKIVSQFVQTRLRSTRLDQLPKQTLLTTVDTGVVGEMRNVGSELYALGQEYAPIRDALNAASDALLATLSDIGKFNSHINNTIIDRAVFKTEYLTANNISGYLIENSAWVASKRAINAATLAEWFTIKGDFHPEVYAELNDLGYKLNRMRDVITNLSLIEDNISGLEKAFKYLKSSPAVADTFKYQALAFSSEPRGAYAATKYLYDRVLRKSKLTAQTIGIQDKTVLGMLEDMSTVTGNHRIAKSIEQQYTDIKFWDTTITIGKMLEELDGFGAVGTEYLHLLDKVTDKYGVHSISGKASVALQQHILSTMQESMANLSSYLKAASKEDIPKIQQVLNDTHLRTAFSATQHILRMDADELTKYIVEHGKGVLYINTTSFAGSASYIKQLRETVEQGQFLDILELDEGIVSILVHKDYLRGMTEIKPSALKSTLQYTDDEYVHAELMHMRNMLNDYSLNRIGHSTGEIVGKDFHDEVFRTVTGSDESVKYVTPTDVAVLKGYRGVTFNHSVIGGYGTHQMFNKFAAANPFKPLYYAAQTLLDTADATTKYSMIFFNPNNVFSFNTMFKDVADDVLLKELLHRKDIELVYLTEDTTSLTGVRVRKAVLTKKALAKARSGELNIAVVPSVLYHEMTAVLNKWEMPNMFVKFFKNVIVQPSKIGYIATPGWAVRNIIDSGVKTILAGAGGYLPHAIKYYHGEYDQILKKILLASDGGYPTSEAFTQVLSEYTAEQGHLFRVVYGFFNSTAGGGQIAALAEIVKLGNDADALDKFLQGVNTVEWKYNPMGHTVFTINEHSERTARLAVFFSELARGEGTMFAASKTVNTHFNFSNTTTKWQMYLDLVIPFVGFTLNNMKFWMEALENMGWAASLMRDIIMPILNLDEYSNYELNDNRSLQYNILAGNLVLDDNTTIKLGMSIMDTIGTLSNPSDALFGNIGSYISVPMDAVIAQLNGEPWSTREGTNALLSNLPLIGPDIMRYYMIEENPYTGELENNGSAFTAFERTGNEWTLVVPSILGGVQRYQYFSYPGADKIYATPYPDRFRAYVSDGAIEITDLEQFIALSGQPQEQREWVQYRRTPKTYPVRHSTYYPEQTYIPRSSSPRVYHSRTYHNMSYIPRSYSPAFNSVSYSALQRNPRFGGRPPSLYRSPHVSRGFYSKMYTGTGTNLWTTRLLETTPYTVQYKIRGAWSYLR